jgi:hypothetical protein
VIGRLERVLRGAGPVFVGLSLTWEVLQLPLYTLWWTDPLPRIALAVLHCTVGDLMIGAAAVTLALVVAGREWPERASARTRVIALSTLFGTAYTIFSEWLNVVVRQTWAYTELMPQVPLLGTGLSPLLQWLILPGLALWLAEGQISPARRPTTATAPRVRRPQQSQ